MLGNRFKAFDVLLFKKSRPLDVDNVLYCGMVCVGNMFVQAFYYCGQAAVAKRNKHEVTHVCVERCWDTIVEYVKSPG